MHVTMMFICQQISSITYFICGQLIHTSYNTVSYIDIRYHMLTQCINGTDKATVKLTLF